MHFTVLCTLLAICVSTKAAKPRSINVALDTVFEFDKPSDIDFIDKVHEILNKVKNAIKDNPKKYRTERYKFKNFVEDAIDVLQSFNDEDLREIILIVNNEIRKHLQGNALEENIRRFLSDEHNRFKIRPIKEIRKDLDQLLKKVKNGKHENNNNNFLGFINTLYKRDSEKKLARFIRKLKMFRRNDFSGKSERLQQDVRRLLSSVIFEHFMNMSGETKRKLVATIEEYLHDAVYRDQDNHFSSQHYEVEAQKFDEIKNESDISSEALEDNASLVQDENKSRVEGAIRDQSDSSKELVKKESVGTSGETSSETNNAKRNFKRKIKKNTTTSPNIKIQRRYQEVKMKRTQNSKKLEERSSGEIIRKVNTQYTISTVTHYRKLTKNPNLTHSRRKFTHDKTFYPKDIGNENFESVFRNAKDVDKGNIEKADTDEILNDITLSSISNSAEINVNFNNNKMQFSFKDRDDTVEDTVARAKHYVKAKEQNPMATRAAEKQTDKPTNRQIVSPDSIENRRETSKKRFKTVNRSRRLFRGRNIIDKAPKLVEYEQDIFNINKIDNFKKNDNTGKTNNKKSPKIFDFRRKDYILAKELIADKLDARKKLDQNEYYNRPQYPGDHAVEENKSRDKFNTINIHNDISAQNKPDGTLAKANKNNFVDDLNVAKTKSVNRLKTKEITYEQQDSDNNITVNVADTSIRTIELTTENMPSYRRTKELDQLNEVSLNSTRSNKNIFGEFNINNIPNVSQNIDSKSIKKLSNKSHTKYNADITEILKNIHESKSTIQKHMPQTYTSEPTLIEFTQKIKDFNTNNFRREKIRHVKQNGIKSVLKNRSELFETDSKPNKAESRDVRRQFKLITTRNIHKSSNKKLNNSTLFNETNDTNKKTDLYKKYINTEVSRKLPNINPISTTKINRTIESKNKETKSNIFNNFNNSTILLNTKPRTKSSTTMNTNTNSEILKHKDVAKRKTNINNTRELNVNKIKLNKTEVIDSRRNLSTPKTTTLIDLDANLDDLAFEATMADVNTNIIEADSTFDLKEYLKNRELPIGEDDPKNEIAKKMKKDLENIFTMPVSSASTTAAYTDIFEALENAFDL